MPANGDGVLRESHFRTKTGLFDDLAQLHVIDDFHGQAPVRATALVGTAFEQLKCTHAHVGAGMWVADARRVGGEMETEPHESKQDLFPEAGHFDFAEQRKLVEIALFYESDWAAQDIGLETYVGV